MRETKESEGLGSKLVRKRQTQTQRLGPDVPIWWPTKVCMIRASHPQLPLLPQALPTNAERQTEA